MYFRFPSRGRAFYSKNTFFRRDFTSSICYRAASCLLDTQETHDFKTYVYKDLIHNRRFYRESEPLENHRDFMFFVRLTAVFRFERIENIFGHWEIWLTLFLLLKNVFFKLVFYDHNVLELWRPSFFRKTTSKVACITAIDGYVDSCWTGNTKNTETPTCRIPGFRIFLIHITAVKSSLIVSKYDRKTIFMIRVDLVSFYSFWTWVSAIVEIV